jgi:hypothetical protein
MGENIARMTARCFSQYKADSAHALKTSSGVLVDMLLWWLGKQVTRDF